MTPHSFRTFRMPIRIATCIALAVLGACTSPPVRFHTLGMADGAGGDTDASRPAWLIDMQRVHVAAPADGNRLADYIYSRLLSSNSWGHTAYGTSACVTSAVDRYLLTKRVPAAGTTCVGDSQPFTDPVGGPLARSAQGAKKLPPVVPPVPGATPRR